MIAGTIWNALVSTLQNYPGLSYIKYVFERNRSDIEPESLPCLMLEPVSDGEIEKDMNNVQNVYLTVNILAFSSNNFNEFKKTIIGDDMYKGVFDINVDLRACLQRSYTLGLGQILDTRLQPTEYDLAEFDKFPAYGMRMPVKILYRQVNEG